MPRGRGGRGHGLARGPDRTGGGGTEDEQGPRLCARVGRIRLEVACGKCGIVKHPMYCASQRVPNRGVSRLLPAWGAQGRGLLLGGRADLFHGYGCRFGRPAIRGVVRSLAGVEASARAELKGGWGWGGLHRGTNQWGQAGAAGGVVGGVSMYGVTTEDQ